MRASEPVDAAVGMLAAMAIDELQDPRPEVWRTDGKDTPPAVPIRSGSGVGRSNIRRVSVMMPAVTRIPGGGDRE